MAARRTTTWVCCLLLVGALTGITSVVRAQPADSDSALQRFVHNMGKTLYFLAWPSATYEGVTFEGVSSAANGSDVRLTLFGKSAFSGERLWTELVLELRNGRVSNLRWGRNNAVLAKPGETVAAFGQFLEELNRQYARSRSDNTSSSTAAALTLTAVCLNNRTPRKIAYRLRWSGRADDRVLEPGQAHLYWASATDPEFSISFDDSFEPGYTERRMRLIGVPRVAEPSTCDDVAAYDFELNAPLVGLSSRRWLPDTEHPFNANVLRSSEQGKWQCAPGFKWISPQDPTSLECIERDVGLVGVTFALEASDSYPKIASITPGGSADAAGLVPGFFVLSVDRASTEGLSLRDLLQRVRGKVGTTVRFEVSRQHDGAEPLSIVLTRH